ncbi:MAG: hypothetical protein EXQ87_03750 [Alphaproteobacteria bacterium]|nr:hypothetical protein [Alphaproteobacteria bacterium]
MAIAATATLALGAGQALALHIFFEDIRINGIALDSSGGLTDPVFTIEAGESLTYSVVAFGDPGTLFFSFYQDMGSLPALTSEAITFDGVDGTTLSFSHFIPTMGNWIGSIYATFGNIVGPDYPPLGHHYYVPLDGSDPCDLSDPSGIPSCPVAFFPFTVNVILELASLAMLGIGLAALGFVRRRRNG